MSGCSLEHTHATRTDRCPACGHTPQASSILQRDLQAATSGTVLPLTAAQKAQCYAQTERLSPLSGRTYYELCAYPKHQHGDSGFVRDHQFVPWQGSDYQRRVGDRRDGRDPKHNRRASDVQQSNSLPRGDHAAMMHLAKEANCYDSLDVRQGFFSGWHARHRYDVECEERAEKPNRPMSYDEMVEDIRAERSATEQALCSSQFELAHFIASVAHGAKGQMRADGVTPYIVHPERVAYLTGYFTGLLGDSFLNEDRLVAAYLHDVLEDTHVTVDHLKAWGITPRQVEIVKLLTKEDPHGKAQAGYYENIAADPDALVVKCADRCANLEDALKELLVEEPTEPRRWGRYVQDTYDHVLPMFDTLPMLRKELEERLAKIEAALPAALKRRANVVARQREKINK